MASNFVEKLRKNIELDKTRIERAIKMTPEEYRQFIVIIDQPQKIADRELDIDSTLESLGCFTSRGKTYQRRQAPYMAVDGRIRQMVDQHREADAKYFISQEIDWEHHILTVIFESEIFGRTVGSAKINIGGTGADSTNPVENAQTSALGRALAQAGYGLFGTGSIASAEEVQSALAEQEMKEEAQTQTQEEQKKETLPARNVASRPSRNGKTEQPPAGAAQKSASEETQKPAAGAAPQFDPVEVRRLIKIKENLGIKTNEGLNEYVVDFGKSINDERICKYTHLIGDLLRQFNDYMEQRVHSEKAAS